MSNLRADERCFIERDPTLSLARRAAAEGLGTLLLVLAAAGGAELSSGLAAAAAVSGALMGLILALGAVSGGHFNPTISGLQWLAGERSGRCAAAYICAQTVGGVLGALAAAILYGGAPQASLVLPTPNLAWSELLATLGLMVVVLGCSRSGLAQTGPFAVGAWLTAAILVTPSGSYANPAVTVAALVARGPLALPLSTATTYVSAQIAGGLLALLAIAFLFPRQPAPGSPTSDKDTAP